MFDETIRSVIIEPDHLILQCAPAIPLTLGPRGSIEHRADRQQPARLRSAGLGDNREFDETAPTRSRSLSFYYKSLII
jgi:hypothetical protein